jgi:hypothetical protein
MLFRLAVHPGQTRRRLGQGLAGLHDGVHHARPVLKTWKAPHHVEVSRGWGTPPVSPARGVAEWRVPDRATLKPTSGAMVAVLRFFRASHCLLCAALPILRAIKTLNFSSGRLTPPLSFLLSSKRPLLDFWMNSMNFDELIQLQVLKHKA